MTQLNLLPDVKLAYLRTTRNKRLVMGASLLVIAASVTVLLLLGSVVYVFQKKNISDLNHDITSYNKTLKDTKDLDKVLTVQSQLSALTTLHESKPVASRLFSYLQQVTPSAASISQLDTDFDASTMTITGSADSLDVANTYIDTLKFTTYQMAGATDSTSTKAFSNVVMSQFSRDSEGAKYTITLSYDPNIFNVANDIKLTIPKIISTRSSTDKPTDLFQTNGAGGRQ
jgi:Tfp pilus assembly protein PilN